MNNTPQSRASNPNDAWNKLQQILRTRVPSLLGTGGDRSSCRLVRCLFLRGLGLIYLSAFVSLRLQVDGLFGSDGVWPMNLIKEAQGTGWERFWAFPSLCWLSDGDWFLHLLCGGGVACAVLLVAGFLQAPCLFLLWLLYLSLSSGNYNVFLSFQWDILLLETGFLAIFFAPLQIGPRHSTEPNPPRIIIPLFRILLFKLMFLSGAVKLLSEDAVWWDLTALTAHYETQPLPTWMGWYAHQLPLGLQKLSCGIMFFIELIVPFLIFGPRPLRIISFWAFSAFQCAIALTGNYCFFNLLTALLGLTLLDDDAIQRLIPFKLNPFSEPEYGKWRKRVSRMWNTLLPSALSLIIIPVTAFQILRPFGVQWFWLLPGANLSHWLSPFRSLNSYGLFADMTETRPEIVIQGSDDGDTWRDYEFEYKPGALDQRPRFNIPHQPRLDWQMWFAALGNFRQNPWLGNFCVRLLQGEETVLRLLGENPFPNRPPKYVRAILYEYHFTNLSERREIGNWWKRKEIGVYLPPISLKVAQETPPSEDF